MASAEHTGNESNTESSEHIRFTFFKPIHQEGKEDLINYLQDEGYRRGLTSNQVRHALAQLECENGDWNPARQEIGGSHHFGLYQASTVYFPQAKDPAWRQDGIRQVNEFLDMFQERLRRYNGDMNRVLLHHFYPKGAVQGLRDFPKHRGQTEGYVANIINNCLPRFNPS